MSRRGARRTEGPFALLPCDVLESAAVRTLPHLAFRVLVAVAAQYHGGRNGSLTITRDVARKYGIANPFGLAAALRELEERGLILRTRPGTRIPPRSAMFAVTWLAIDEPLKHDPHDARPTIKPTNAYGSWLPEKVGLHWTVKRRAPMYRRATASISARLQGNAETSSTRLHVEPDLPVAQGYYSQSSALRTAPAQRRRQRRAA